ncbi:clasp N terminal-domain-containing protein [Mycena sp. CBHHK59/15]|nr:clasp N terminal-domain-containing protein [Mycena sp. CBHHK59/15]
MPSVKKTIPNPGTMFQRRFDAIRADLSLTETEETWDAIARSLSILAELCTEVASGTPADIVVSLRSISRPVTSAMNSERSRLSGVAIDLIGGVATCLGAAFEPLLPHFFPVLLVLASRTSKVTVARARTCILTIIEATHLPPVLSYLMQSVTDKSASLRLTVVESTLACMNCFNPPDLEKDARAKEVETIIRATARDANADVRKVSRKIFEAHKLLLPNRWESFTLPLTPTTRKYLEIHNKVTDRLQPSHPHHPVQLKTTQLSASTSVLRSTSSQRPHTHARSASSPTVAADVATTGVVNERIPLTRAKVDMPPPNLPKTSQPPRPVTVPSRPPSVDERKRVVSLSAAVRPAPVNSTSDRGRPILIPNHLARRLPPADNARQPAATATSVIARRVPISEVQPKHEEEKMIRAHSRSDNSASTPAIRPVSAPKPANGEPIKPSLPRTAPIKDRARVPVKQTAREPTKQRSLTQPTLSQISRAKTNERRVPVPAVPKPLWGKAAPRKAQQARPTKVIPTVIVTKAAEQTGNPAPHESKPCSVIKQDTLNSDEGPEEGTSGDSGHTTENDHETSQSEARDLEEQLNEARIIITENPASNAGPEPVTPPKLERDIALDKTPISELLLSIERGFLFTPSAPLSPPQSYLSFAPTTHLAIPFPLHPARLSTEPQQDEEPGEGAKKMFEVIHTAELRQALGDVALNN